MTEISTLVTRPQRNSQQNRDAFINEARHESKAFGSNLVFDAKSWDVSQYCPRPAGKAGRKVILYFTTHDNGTSKGPEERVALPEPFASVIKAIVRTKKDGNPKIGQGPLDILIRASRFLIPLLEDRAFDPCLILPSDFDAACEAVKGHSDSPDTRYRLGNALQQISVTLTRRGIPQFNFAWRNPLRRPQTSVRVGRTAEAAKRKKMPETEVLDELARLSHLLCETSDLVLMAAVKLFHCAPWRIGEVNTLPADCWVEKEVNEADGFNVDAVGGSQIRYGIRYWPEKADKADIKWLPSAMVPVAKSAIDTLLSASEGPRKLAAWYENNPGRAWLPGEDLGSHQRYTIAEIVEMFGLSSTTAARRWLEARAVPIEDGTVPHTVSRGDVEEALLKRWEKFDYLEKDRRGVRRSNHLFLTFANQHSYRGTNFCMIGFTTDQNISDFLSGRGDYRNGRMRSIFERFGSVGSNGEAMRVNSHAFRHWLNTLAQRGGLNELLVARWSGRKDIGQNSAYDHVSGVEFAEKARDLLAGGKVMGALADVHDRLPPAEREGFRDTVFATAFVTELGMCDADFTTSPCPEFGACSTCENCNIRKGDKEARARTEAELKDARWLYQRALEEEGEGTIGASNYVEAHRQRIESLERIMEIHDDPTIPDGTWVRPNAASKDHYGGPELKAG